MVKPLKPPAHTATIDVRRSTLVTIVSKATDNYPDECTGNLKSKQRNLVRCLVQPEVAASVVTDERGKGRHGKGIRWAGLHGVKCT